MDKFGTGSAQAIWGWWGDFHKEHVKDGGFVGFLKGIVPIIIAFIGVIIMGIVDIIVEFFVWLVGVFNGTDDDNARRDINEAADFEINEWSDDEIIARIESMLDGATLNEDENAILRVLRILPCERVRRLVARIGRERLESDFHGAEYDRLRVLFGNCGIISFSAWDDDATRHFINSNNCEVLENISAEQARALINNLFDWPTRDNDEAAINKLIGCLPTEVVVEIISTPGFTIRDFRDKVQGEEWEELNILFNPARAMIAEGERAG